jgi:hypothetical protein
MSALRQKQPDSSIKVQLPLTPRKQTQLGHRTRSEKCQKRPFHFRSLRKPSAPPANRIASVRPTDVGCS